MSQELGRLEKPEAAPFRPERKIYLVPFILAPAKPPAEYAAVLERYWTSAADHISRLEISIGQVSHVYVELVDRAGKEGLEALAQFSPGAAKLASYAVDRSATFEALEDAETLAEAMDWERCLLAGLMSRKASQYVSQAYRDASDRRYRFMAQRFDETLKDGEAGLALLTEHHRVQFPDSIRVFYVAPPALDEVHRFLRDYREPREAPAEGPEPPAEEQSDEQARQEG